MRRGQDAEHRQDYDRAVVEYTKALRLTPTTRTRALRSIAPSCARAGPFPLAAAASPPTGKFDEALVEFELASELNPTSGEVDDELRATRNKLRAKSRSRVKARPSCRR